MPRLIVLLALTGILAASPASAVAQGGGAEAPGPSESGADADGGGAGYYPNAKAPAKPPEKRRSRRPPAKKKQQASRRRREGGAPVQTPPPVPPAARGHRFPLAGAFDFGGKDSRFGAGRRGHTHQGQDMSAAEGTPVVAPRTGVVEVVRYQAAGAGHYVVLDGEGEDRDYVFMHLRTGSIVVREGQRVRIGAALGQVGNTGVSSGPHLHFEIWVGGGWYTGGEPIDPFPLLRAWAAR